MEASSLLALSRSCLRELRQRGVVRSGNAPAGDYAEYLVARWSGGTLADPSEKSWDVLTPAPDPERIQVKARVVVDAHNAGQRELSVIRSFDFDILVALLFHDDFRVWRACSLPVEMVK